jgi:hypothetical protein
VVGPEWSFAPLDYLSLAAAIAAYSTTPASGYKMEWAERPFGSNDAFSLGSSGNKRNISAAVRHRGGTSPALKGAISMFGLPSRGVKLADT